MRRIAICLLILCSAYSATAQEKPRLQIAVEDLDEGSAKCGMTASGIESTVALTLRSNGVLTARDTNPFLYVEVAVLFRESTRLCFASTRVSVKAVGVAPRKVGAFAVREDNFSHTELCSSYSIVTAGQANAGRYLSEAIENNVKKCLGALEY